jgi:hypothetical protein
MNLLLLSALCVFSVCAFSQAPDNKNLQLPDTLTYFKGNNSDVLPKQLQDFLQRKKSQDNLLANKKGNVVILPQDHMPCIVPDINSISRMSNAWTNPGIPYKPKSRPIPNPGLPKNQSFELNIPDNSLGSQSK